MESAGGRVFGFYSELTHSSFSTLTCILFVQLFFFVFSFAHQRNYQKCQEHTQSSDSSLLVLSLVFKSILLPVPSSIPQAYPCAWHGNHLLCGISFYDSGKKSPIKPNNCLYSSSPPVCIKISKLIKPSKKENPKPSYYFFTKTCSFLLFPPSTLSIYLTHRRYKMISYFFLFTH